MTNNKKISGFSLVELSITILIIGILVSAIVKGKSLYRDIKLTAAKSLTKSSVVSSIKNLHVWYETTSDSSFNENEVIDGEDINKWHDINPVNTLKNNLVMQQAGKVPNYEANCINGLPCLRFDRNNGERLVGEKSVNINGDSAQGTIFIVGISLNAATAQYPVSISGGGPFEVFRIDVNTSSNGAGVRFQGANRLFSSPFKHDIPFISTWTFPQASTSQYFDLYVNGKKQTIASIANAAIEIKNIELVVGGENYLGNYGSFFDGKIAEIIIFDRYLSNKERQSVEKYLGQKYSIKVTH